MKIKFPVNKRRISFLSFIKNAHGDQKRKYTGEPYWYHLIDVANIYYKYTKLGDLGIEICLGHDLFEDTVVTPQYLKYWCELTGYSTQEIKDIVNGIIELTDVYTVENYPNLNRKKRKTLESERLSTISKLGQTIKYCDHLSNLPSISKHDPEFASVYILEIEDKIELMIDGDLTLRNMVKELIVLSKQLIEIKVSNKNMFLKQFLILKLRINNIIKNILLITGPENRKL